MEHVSPVAFVDAQLQRELEQVLRQNEMDYQVLLQNASAATRLETSNGLLKSFKMYSRSALWSTIFSLAIVRRQPFLS